LKTDGTFFVETPPPLLFTEHRFKVVATDSGGHSAAVAVTVHLEDVNDLAPKFRKKVYQGFMTPDLARRDTFKYSTYMYAH
jgi:hypothetical protein